MSATPAQPPSASRWPCLRSEGQARVSLSVAVQPGARRSEVDGLHDGALRIRLAAPPVEGRANAALVAWLAGQLQLRQRDVVLMQGERSRRKRLRIEADLAHVEAWLERVAGGPN